MGVFPLTSVIIKAVGRWCFACTNKIQIGLIDQTEKLFCAEIMDGQPSIYVKKALSYSISSNLVLEDHMNPVKIGLQSKAL
jgi:hypothetical protein